MQTITIIGAGAAGLMTAATLLEQAEGSDFRIQIFEKNAHPGKKILLSGGGRCNVTTGIEDKKILLTKYTRGADFIKKAFGKFSPKKCREWFECHGVSLKCEIDNRVFPVSDDGTEIVEVFEHIFGTYPNKIVFHYNESVQDIKKYGESGESEITENTDIQLQNQEKQKYKVYTAKGVYESDFLVITTGGNAYSHTGSSGDGYAFARSLGHSVTQLGPSLSSFLTKEKWTHMLSGLAFEEAKIGILEGSLLLTHFGISGPLTFMVSSQVAWETINKSTTKSIQFSPIAKMGYKEWNHFLMEQFTHHPKKLITNILTEHLPRRFSEGFIQEYFAHIEMTYPVSINKIDREKIARLLGDGIPLTLIERRPGDEFVTAGGVSTHLIDPESMESKIQKNLYFAGEILNVDGYTGGFSLQICWASGYATGVDIAKKIQSA